MAKSRTSHPNNMPISPTIVNQMHHPSHEVVHFHTCSNAEPNGIVQPLWQFIKYNPLESAEYHPALRPGRASAA